MGPIVIYYHVIIMESDFELARQGLNEFVHLGHKGLMNLHSSTNISFPFL